MSHPDQERQVDYGNDAVRRPAEEALGYGDRAVGQGVLVAQASKQKKQKQAQQAPAKNRLTVNSESKLSAKQLVNMLQKSSLPKVLRTRIKLDSKTKTIDLPAATSIAAREKQEWIGDFLTVSTDWEITTARLVIVVDDQSIRGQLLEPHLGAGEERGRISDSDDIGLMPITADIHGMGTGMMLGKTVANERLSDRKSMTEIVTLNSGRGLVVVVTEVIVKKGLKITDEPIKVPSAVVTKNLVHELAAHAGLFSQGKSAEHGDDRVERNVEQVEKLFKSRTEKDEDKLQAKVQTYIEAMKKEK